MRLDRELTLRLFRPAERTPNGWLPILMYHSISGDPEDGVHPYYRVATTAQRFAEQMRWLAEMGYTGVSLEDAIESKVPMRAAITFDDGFRDFYTAAWPVLRKLKFTATMYLPTRFIGASYKEKPCLTWQEVRELRRQGVRFGSHTVNHPTLHRSSWDEIRQELTQSKQQIEQEMGDAISSFAYPFAFPQEDRPFTQRLTNTLKECGYTSCATTIIGRHERDGSPFQLKRLPINDCDDRSLFEAKLNGAYDWMAGPQRVFRRVKSYRRGV